MSGAEFERRPGLTRLVSSLSPRPPFDVLIMSELSRLGREQIETAYVLKRISDAGVRTWCYLEDREAVLGSALDKVMVTLTGFGAELEREKARARTFDALSRKAKAGHVTGGTCYGYVNVRVDGHVERQIHASEAAIVRRIFTDYAAGVGLKKLAATLTAERAPAPVPRRRAAAGWTSSAILPMLTRDLYRGIVTWGARKKTDVGGRTEIRRLRPEGERITVEVPALRIVSDELWQAVAARRQRNRERAPAGHFTHGTAPPALLAGIGRCATCGASLSRNVRTHGSPGRRFRVTVFGCQRRCGGVELPEPVVDKAVLDALAEALRPDHVAAAIRQAVEDEKQERAGSADRRAALDRDLRAVQARIDQLTEAVAAGGIVVAPLLEKLGQEEAHRQEFVRQRTALDALDGASDLATAAVKRAIIRAASGIRAALRENPAEARDVLRAAVDVLTFAPFGHGRARGFDFKGDGDLMSLCGTTRVPNGVPQHAELEPAHGVAARHGKP